MKGTYRQGVLLTVAGILTAGLLPAVFFWIVCGSVPNMNAAAVRQALLDPRHPAALVDIREPSEYGRGHIQGALNWPFPRIMAISSGDQIPTELKGRTLFLICDAGIASATAARTINAHTPQTNFSVRGGIQNWTKDMQRTPEAYGVLQSASGDLRPFPVRPLSLFVQVIACMAAFAVKPLYMLLSLAGIWVLRRQQTADLISLKWAMIFFLAGESFCAVNYLFFQDDSYLVEYLHIYGMLLAFGFTIHAVMEGFDLRIMRLHHPQKKCAAVGICPTCIKYAQVPCGFSRILLLLSVMMGSCSLIPLLAGIHHDAYGADIFGTRYLYTHPAVYQYVEFRYAPVLAIFCFAAVAIITWRKPIQPPPLVSALFAAGSGLIGFAFFRLVLFAVYRDRLQWFVIWEELTELLYILGAIAVMWTFRSTLFQKDVRVNH